MVNIFTLTVVHFACPNLMQICACAWIYHWTKNCEKSGQGLWAYGPPGRRGPWATGRWAILGRGVLDCWPPFRKTPVNQE